MSTNRSQARPLQFSHTKYKCLECGEDFMATKRKKIILCEIHSIILKKKQEYNKKSKRS